MIIRSDEIVEIRFCEGCLVLKEVLHNVNGCYIVEINY